MIAPSPEAPSPSPSGDGFASEPEPDPDRSHRRLFEFVRSETSDAAREAELAPMRLDWRDSRRDVTWQTTGPPTHMHML
jgi:hypothetical protein